MASETELTVSVWDEDQVLVDVPPESLAVRLWAETARRLIGADTPATVSVDCDDADTELRLRVSGFALTEVEPEEEPPPEEATVVLEREGRLGDLIEAVLRLPPEAPLGALAIAKGRGVDLDYGAGLDVWGPGAAAALRAAATEIGLTVRELPPED